LIRARIRGSGSVPKSHGSKTLPETRSFLAHFYTVKADILFNIGIFGKLIFCHFRSDLQVSGGYQQKNGCMRRLFRQLTETPFSITRPRFRTTGNNDLDGSGVDILQLLDGLEQRPRQVHQGKRGLLVVDGRVVEKSAVIVLVLIDVVVQGVVVHLLHLDVDAGVGGGGRIPGGSFGFSSCIVFFDLKKIIVFIEKGTRNI
jgi:hypothetical protein